MAEDKTTPPPNDPEHLVCKRPPQFYLVWQKEEGIPIHDTFYIEDLSTAEVALWSRFGGNGC